MEAGGAQRLPVRGRSRLIAADRPQVHFRPQLRLDTAESIEV